MRDHMPYTIVKARKNKMPFKSKAQQRFLYANKPEGVSLKKWSKQTNFKKLPERVEEKKAASLSEKTAFIKRAIWGHILGRGLLGAGMGAISAGEGNRMQGAVMGGLAGGALGGASRAISNKLTLGRFTVPKGSETAHIAPKQLSGASQKFKGLLDSKALGRMGSMGAGYLGGLTARNPSGQNQQHSQQPSISPMSFNPGFGYY